MTVSLITYPLVTNKQTAQDVTLEAGITDDTGTVLPSEQKSFGSDEMGITRLTWEQVAEYVFNFTDSGEEALPKNTFNSDELATVVAALQEANGDAARPYDLVSTSVGFCYRANGYNPLHTTIPTFSIQIPEQYAQYIDPTNASLRGLDMASFIELLGEMQPTLPEVESIGFAKEGEGDDIYTGDQVEVTINFPEGSELAQALSNQQLSLCINDGEESLPLAAGLVPAADGETPACGIMTPWEFGADGTSITVSFENTLAVGDHEITLVIGTMAAEGQTGLLVVAEKPAPPPPEIVTAPVRDREEPTRVVIERREDPPPAAEKPSCTAYPPAMQGAMRATGECE